MTCTGQCSSCAFKRGAAANMEPDNHLKGFLTVLAGQPFFCHSSMNWEGKDTQQAKIVKAPGNIMRAAILTITLPGQEPKICSGWKAAVKRLHAVGWYGGKVGNFRRELARYANRRVEEFVSISGSGKRSQSAKKRAINAAESTILILATDLKELGVFPEEIGLDSGFLP